MIEMILGCCGGTTGHPAENSDSALDGTHVKVLPTRPSVFGYFYPLENGLVRTFLGVRQPGERCSDVILRLGEG
jgi:hypothetical protein